KITWPVPPSVCVPLPASVRNDCQPLAKELPLSWTVPPLRVSPWLTVTVTVLLMFSLPASVTPVPAVVLPRVLLVVAFSWVAPATVTVPPTIVPPARFQVGPVPTVRLLPVLVSVPVRFTVPPLIEKPLTPDAAVAKVPPRFSVEEVALTLPAFCQAPLRFS